MKAGSPDMFTFTHLLLEGKSKYSPNLKPYSRTHDIVDVVEAFSHITFNYNHFLPVQIKTKPTLFTLKRKKSLEGLFKAAFKEDDEKEKGLEARLEYKGKKYEEEEAVKSFEEDDNKSKGSVGEMQTIDIPDVNEEQDFLRLEKELMLDEEKKLYKQDNLYDEENELRKIDDSPKSKGSGKRKKRKATEEKRKDLKLYSHDVNYVQTNAKLSKEAMYVEDINASIENIVQSREEEQHEIKVKEKIKALIREEKEEEERLKRKLKPIKGKLEILLAEKKNAKLSKSLKFDSMDHSPTSHQPTYVTGQKDDSDKEDLLERSEEIEGTLKAKADFQHDSEEDIEKPRTVEAAESSSKVDLEGKTSVSELSVDFIVDSLPPVAGKTAHIPLTDPSSQSDVQKSAIQTCLTKTVGPTASIEEKPIRSTVSQIKLETSSSSLMESQYTIAQERTKTDVNIQPSTADSHSRSPVLIPTPMQVSPSETIAPLAAPPLLPAPTAVFTSSAQLQDLPSNLDTQQNLLGDGSVVTSVKENLASSSSELSGVNSHQESSKEVKPQASVEFESKKLNVLENEDLTIQKEPSLKISHMVPPGSLDPSLKSLKPTMKSASEAGRREQSNGAKKLSPNTIRTNSEFPEEI